MKLINKYLITENSLSKDIKKVIKWLNYEFDTRGLQVQIVWNKGNKWNTFDFSDGDVNNEQTVNRFEDLGIGKESEWPNAFEEDLAKVLKVKKAYVMDL